MLMDLGKHPEFEDQCGRALLDKIRKSQGLDFIIDGDMAGSEQWKLIYQLASPKSFVDFMVEAIDEASTGRRYLIP